MFKFCKVDRKLYFGLNWLIYIKDNDIFDNENLKQFYLGRVLLCYYFFEMSEEFNFFYV